MTTIVLARHGETRWNRDSRFQGHADPPLTALGRAQARALAASLAGERLDAVYSSPLRRALETAEIVAQRLALEVQPVEDLREVDVGSWQGLTRAEVAERFPEEFARWLAFGAGWSDGESYEQLGERVSAALLALGERHAGGAVLAVTHGGPMRSALAAADGISHEQARRRGARIENCGVARIVVRDGGFRRID